VHKEDGTQIFKTSSRQVQHGGLVAHGGWRTRGIVPNGEGEPVWLTPHQRDSQPEGQRERLYYYVHVYVGSISLYFVFFRVGLIDFVVVCGCASDCRAWRTAAVLTLCRHRCM